MCARHRFFLPAVGYSNGMIMQGMKAKGTMALGRCACVAGRVSPSKHLAED